MTAFKGKQSVKNKYVKRVKSHYESDEIVQGIYWENGKGCAVGCTLEYDNSGESIHQRMEDQLGVPRILARLEDKIFEGLDNGDAKKFPLEFLEAITPGADLSMVYPKFIVWLLKDKKDGVWQYARTDGKRAITKVVKLYQRKILGEAIAESEWRAAAYAAEAAAYAAYYAADAADAAYYAADAAAAEAAADAADAAYYAADAADAAYYAAEADVRRTHYKKMADKLIELLKETI